MLEVVHISKNYGRYTPVRNVSFTLKTGEVAGLLGANGTGKSTTLNMIAGYFPPSSGTISLNGCDIDKDPLNYKKNIGYLPEVPPLYPDMTIREQLYMVCSVREIPSKERLTEIDRVCRMSGIPDVKERLIRNMSKGYRQRIGFAQALIGHPQLLILDEPTAGLDPQQIIDIIELINDLKKEHSVIISSHILSEIASVSTRILVLNNGHIVADSPSEDLLNSPSGPSILDVRILGNSNAIREILESLNGVKELEIKNCAEHECSDYSLTLENHHDIRVELFQTLAENNFPIMLLKMKNPTLEEIFIDLTTRKN